jgi:hypothetical protein
MFSTRLSGLTMILPAILLASSLSAAIPDFIPYQGYLTDSAGDPVSGSLDLQFALYDQAEEGAALWQETHVDVAVVAGFFRVELGTLVTLSNSLFDAPLFLGVTIAGESEMTPRMRIGSVPFARISEALACSVGETNCGGMCADLDNSLEHCGQCNLACASSNICVEGSCVAQQTWYRDNDGDGYGQCDDSVLASEANAPYTALVCGDCDDDDPAVNPGAVEVCDDGIDNNCSGLVDCADDSCPGGGDSSLTFCDGSCQDLSSDLSHCGACNVDCGGPDSQCALFFCTDGQCGVDFQTGNVCDDGDACTHNESCDGAGNCVGTPIDCDDGDACTIDQCDSLIGCQYTPAQDGTVCPGGFCNSGICQT